MNGERVRYIRVGTKKAPSPRALKADRDCTISSVARVERRGVDKGLCRTCGEQIMIMTIGRSIWHPILPGGSGEVRIVGEAYCPQCDREPTLPSYGTPIRENEIVKVTTLGEVKGN